MLRGFSPVTDVNWTMPAIISAFSIQISRALDWVQSCSRSPVLATLCVSDSPDCSAHSFLKTFELVIGYLLQTFVTKLYHFEVLAIY